MTEAIIWYVTMFGAALTFCTIGVYAQNRKQPMWFWAGSDADPANITDVTRYNKENGIMWMLYSLWFWAAGLAEAWSTAAALLILVCGGTLGLGLLVVTYKRIVKKYSVQQSEMTQENV